MEEARLQSMICPIGVGGIRSKLPAAIAVSVAAQVITLDEALSAGTTQGKLAARERRLTAWNISSKPFTSPRSSAR